MSQKDEFEAWWNMATSDDSQDATPLAPEPEKTTDLPFTLENIVNASQNGWAKVIVNLFSNVPEAKRSSMRKEYLKEHQLYGTLYTSETAPHWKRTTQATKLLDIALGNKQEVLYALNPCFKEFPKESIRILSERPADWLGKTIERHILANPIDSFPSWAELVIAKIIDTTWDDRTIQLIGVSGMSMGGRAMLKKYLGRLPDLGKHLHRLMLVENWAASAPQTVIDAFYFLTEKSLPDRLLWIRSALHGLYQVNNQNHTRGCQAILDAIDPSLEELEQCQSELAAVLDQAKPFVFEPIFQLLQRLQEASKLDWSILGPSIGSVFSRAGIAQSKSAIQLLAASTRSENADKVSRLPALSALCSALLHSKREIAELAWKTLSPQLEASDQAVLEQLRSMLSHITETLRRQIETHPLLANGSATSDAPSPNTSEDGKNEATRPSQSFELPSLDVFPREVSDMLRLSELLSLQNEPTTGLLGDAALPRGRLEDAALQTGHLGDAALQTGRLGDAALQTGRLGDAALQTGRLGDAALQRGQRYLTCSSWNLMQAPVLHVQAKLELLSSLDELVMRLGSALFNAASVDERERLLDGICRFPRGNDPSFALKTAAIKKQADEDDGFINAEWNPDFAWLIRAWLGMERPRNPDRGAQSRMEEIMQHRSVAVEDAVRRGESISLLSIATHIGGWIDPTIFLDRLEHAEANQRNVYVSDLELALLRLAPDGRTTHWKNPSLLERARLLKGPYSTMVRYAMGEPMSESEMNGSQRLWVAAWKSRDPEKPIPDTVPFCVVSRAEGETCPLPKTAVREVPKWNHSYATETKPIEDGRGFRVNFIGGDLERGLVYKPNLIEWGEHVPLAADNYFLTRFLAAQIFQGRFFHYLRRSYWPAQLDWYWYSIASVYMYYAYKKVDFDLFDDIEPLLEPERPLTIQSARILWLSSLTRAEKHRLWTIETWSQLVDDDRLDIPLLMTVMAEFQNQDWIVPKRWAEVLTPVATRSPLHAWDMAKLVVAMLETYPFEAKDVAPLLEIVLEAYTWLGLPSEDEELETMRKFSVGKSKKTIEAIAKLRFVEDGEAAEARNSAWNSRANRRVERARRFSFAP
jgi:hypothetical protein